MSVPRGPLADGELEVLLSAALTAWSSQVRQDDLLPAVHPALPPRPARRTTRRRVSMLLVAASAGVATIGGAMSLTHVYRTDPEPIPSVAGTKMAVGPSESLGRIEYVVDVTGGVDEIAKLRLTFTSRTSHVEATAATATYPQLAVSGGDPGLRRTLEGAVKTRVVALIDAYRNRLISQDCADKPVTQTITVRANAQWGHYVSIVLDNVEDFAGAVPTTSSTAVVIDKRTGRAASAADLFTDVSTVDALMRTAIGTATQPMPPTKEDLAALSMTLPANGITRPLTWYPTQEGLHWVVDRGAIASDAQGEPSATLSWTRLTALLHPGVRPYLP